MVHAVLRSSDQPLIAIEVKQKLAAQNILLDTSYVRAILLQLCEDGLIRSRTETLAERVIRMDGRQENRGKHLNVRYFWAGAGRFPGRTEATEFPAVSQYRNAKKNFRPARQVKMQTGNASALTRAMAPTMLDRIARLEKQVAEIKSLLG
jgi:hypothetical protein